MSISFSLYIFRKFIKMMKNLCNYLLIELPKDIMCDICHLNDFFLCVYHRESLRIFFII